MVICLHLWRIFFWERKWDWIWDFWLVVILFQHLRNFIPLTASIISVEKSVSKHCYSFECKASSLSGCFYDFFSFHLIFSSFTTIHIDVALFCNLISSNSFRNWRYLFKYLFCFFSPSSQFWNLVTQYIRCFNMSQMSLMIFLYFPPSLFSRVFNLNIFSDSESQICTLAVSNLLSKPLTVFLLLFNSLKHF